MSQTQTIYLATNNQDKLQDLAMVFSQLGLKLRRAPKVFPVEENMPTLLENARLKALSCSCYFPQKIILATDGGVKIPHLGEKWNHVLTKRLSGRDSAESFTERQRLRRFWK